MSTNVDVKCLQADPFWNKKFDNAVKVTDTDKNGWIERADFERIVSRYRESCTIKGKPGHIEAVNKSFMRMADDLGLVDDSVQISYAESKERWLGMITKYVGDGMWDMINNSTFDNMDANGDGTIDIEEWCLHCYSLSISTNDAQASFDAMDANGDGLISREEFAAYHTEFFLSIENKLNSAILYGPLAMD